MEMKILPQEFLQSLGSEQDKLGGVLTPFIPSMLDEILLLARRQKASDVHLSAGAPVVLRRFGVLKQVTTERLPAERLSAMLEEMLPRDKWQALKMTGDLEYVHTIPGAGRFRMVVNRQRFGWDLTVRVVDQEVRSFKESRMPVACESLTKWSQGLVLVAGPAGCGKTSTMATLVEMVNQTREDHIVTIENPIEIVYTPKKCQISQREVYLHTLSCANALRAALREDPDIIIVSELRDFETIQLAVTAAETGHLVFATMNTNNVAQTITLLIGSFPPDEQAVVRNMIAASLRGVICQQLIPRADGEGVVPAYEFMTMNTAAASMIKTGRSNQLNNIIATGKSEGMVSMDNSLLALVTDGIIKGQEAYYRAINQNLFVQYAGGIARG